MQYRTIEQMCSDAHSITLSKMGGVQRDKSNSYKLGYFHKKVIFRY